MLFLLLLLLLLLLVCLCIHVNLPRRRIVGRVEALPFPPKAKMPKEYLGLYAPRDDEEFEVTKQILVAAVKFMTGAKDVKTSK